MSYFFWNTNDAQKASICALATCTTSMLGKAIISKDVATTKFLDSLNPPTWIPKCKFFYLTGDALATLPVGYASYLVWFRGGGFDYTDTKLALCLFGANILAGLALIFTVKTKDTKKIALHSGLFTSLAFGVAGAFYYMDSRAGYMALPLAIWSAFHSYIAYYAMRKDGKKSVANFDI